MVTYYFGFPPLGESNLVKGIASLPLWLSLLPQGRGGRAHGASFPGCRLLSPVPGPVLGAAEMWMGLTPCPCCWRPETRLGLGPISWTREQVGKGLAPAHGAYCTRQAAVGLMPQGQAEVWVSELPPHLKQSTCRRAPSHHHRLASPHPVLCNTLPCLQDFLELLAWGV